MIAAGAAVCALAVLPLSGPTEACEKPEWDGGKLTKFVNPDVENNKVTIEVTYKKKTGDEGRSIRFIEMIGPSDWEYNDRIIIGGGHKKIPANQAQGTVKWEVTKDDIPNLRQGVISKCSDCHDEDNMPALDEWPNGVAFDPVTDQEFKDWVEGMKKQGYEQYIDIAKNNNTNFKTRCIQSAKRAQQNQSTSFTFHHLNRGPSGFYRLEPDPSTIIPLGWQLETAPPIGSLYFLNHGETLYATAFVTPMVPVDEGDIAVITIQTIDDDSGDVPETFHFRALRDTQPPQADAGPTAIVVPDGPRLALQFTLTASDPHATVAGARIWHRFNNDAWRNPFMAITSGDSADPVSFSYLSEPLPSGQNFVEWYAEIQDELGNTSLTPVQSAFFSGAAIPVSSRTMLVTLGAIIVLAGAFLLRRGALLTP